jgi:hypothetical protein
VTATTHTEVYRRFQGTLRARPLRWWRLARATIRTASKRRLPLLVLYAPPAIGTVIFSFVVYARFSLEAGVTPAALGGENPGVALIAGMAKTMIQVKEQILIFHFWISMFTLLIFAWFGAGQIAEDRRQGAHLLYFARPLTRLDYVLGKLVAVAFHGGLAVAVPPLVICTVAAFASPDWSFLAQEGGLIPRSLGFALAWTFAWASVALAVSSLCPRKSFALVGCVAFFAIPLGAGGAIGVLTSDPCWIALSLQGALQLVAGGVFDSKLGPTCASWLAWLSAGAWVALAWVVLALRLRRMEGVG